MSDNQLKRIIQKRKMGQDPNADIKVFMLEYLETLIKERLEEAETEFMKIGERTINDFLDSRKDKIRGERGIMGLSGIMGLKGIDGKTPTKAELEALIIPLIPEPSKPIEGKDGKDGSPDNPQQIATKLNILTEVVEQKVIRGLGERFSLLTKSIRDAKREGRKQTRGGGMGDIKHETTSVSSATTTLTTTDPIACAGYAIWAYYQGQLIMRGEHYTVATDNRTLALTFTPTDSTKIDIIYIRG